MKNIEKVNQLLSDAKFYFLSTVDGDSARVRPIGLNLLIEDKIYFGVGTFKEVYKQMSENPNVEICAFVNGKTLRYSGKAVFEADYSIGEKALESIPELRNIYNDETGYKIGMFHLENAKATIMEGFASIETLEL